MTETKANTIMLCNKSVRIYTLSDNDDTQEHTIPILIIPGWGESAKTAMDLAEGLYKSGNNVFVVEYGNLDSPKQIAQCKVENKFPITERARACAIIEFLNSQKEKVHIIAHSQGAIATMISTTSDVKNMGTIILIAPAGIVLLELKQLIFRYIKSFIIQFSNAFKTGDSRGKRYFSEVSKYIGGNPLQLGRDAYGIANVDIVPLLKRAKKQEQPIYIVCNEKDRIFPLEKIKERVEDLFPIHSIHGSHDSLYINTTPFIKYINATLTN